MRELRKWLIERGIMVRIARKGVDTSQKPGRHRRVVERTLARLTNGHRRLAIRRERHARNHLAATLVCFKKLAT